MWCDTPNPPDQPAVGLGAVGATSNPVLILRTVQAAADAWRGEIASCKAEGGLVNWTMYRRVAHVAAEYLQPTYRQSMGKVGLLSVQVDPRNWNDPAKMIPQAREADAIAPNISVKLPVTKAGLVGIEELAASGSGTATVSFSVPQAIAIAEAFNRGKALGGEGRLAQEGEAAPQLCRPDGRQARRPPERRRQGAGVER